MGLPFAPQTAILRDFAGCVGLIRSHPEQRARGRIGADRPGWPKSPRALAGRLRRAQTFLRTLGIEIVFGREGRLGMRTIRITATGENRFHNIVSTVSRVSDNGEGAGPNHPRPGLEQSL